MKLSDGGRFQRLVGQHVTVTNGFPRGDNHLRKLQGVCVWDEGGEFVIVEFAVDVPHGAFLTGSSKQAWVPRRTVTPNAMLSGADR